METPHIKIWISYQSFEVIDDRHHSDKIPVFDGRERVPYYLQPVLGRSTSSCKEKSIELSAGDCTASASKYIIPKAFHPTFFPYIDFVNHKVQASMRDVREESYKHDQ
jgi:hypothetical protein